MREEEKDKKEESLLHCWVVTRKENHTKDFFFHCFVAEGKLNSQRTSPSLWVVTWEENSREGPFLHCWVIAREKEILIEGPLVVPQEGPLVLCGVSVRKKKKKALQRIFGSPLGFTGEADTFRWEGDAQIKPALLLTGYTAQVSSPTQRH